MFKEQILREDVMNRLYISILLMFIIMGAFIYVFSHLLLRMEHMISSEDSQIQNTSEFIIFYVSPNGSDSWSGKLPEPNKDKTDGPFATITRARDAIRELKRKEGLKRPVIVMIRDGIYHLNEPLVFTPEDSGTDDCPIIYQAYPGEHPIISGGVLLKGFNIENLHGKKVWVTEIPEVKEGKWYFRQLFVNGKRRFRPRLPKHGFYRIASVPNYPPMLLKLKLQEGSNSFSYNSGDIRNWRNLQDVEVVILHFWIEERIPIKSVDEEHNLVTLASKTLFVLRDGWHNEYPRYYVENVFEALSEPGEWYLDRSTGRLYYIPMPNERLGNVSIVAPKLKWYLIKFLGEPNKGKYVEHIVLKGLTFQYTDWDHVLSHQAAFLVPGAIYLKGAKSCAIEYCTISHVGGYGIEVGSGCSDIRIVGNEIYDMGAGGIKVGTHEIPRNPLEATHHIVITDNHIHHGGRIFHSAVGIWIGHSRCNLIAHNHIHDLYYTGISIGWTWGYGESYTRYNVVEFNHIHDIGQGLLSDLGGIYTLGIQPGTVIRHNLIYNIEAYDYGGWGIYLDEGSSYILVENNVVYNTMSGSFHQHYGRENVVRNNIFAFGRKGLVVLSKGEEGHIAFIFERNILVSNGSPLFVGGYAERFTLHNIISNYNLFWDISGKEPLLCLEESTGRKYTLSQWRALNYDTFSIIANPKFKDVMNYDFTLLDDSPAFKIYFKPFSLSNVGPRRK